MHSIKQIHHRRFIRYPEMSRTRVTMNPGIAGSAGIPFRNARRSGSRKRARIFDLAVFPAADIFKKIFINFF